MYTHNYYKKCFTFYEKIYNYIKKIPLPPSYKKNSAKYKNGKPRAKFIIK